MLRIFNIFLIYFLNFVFTEFFLTEKLQFTFRQIFIKNESKYEIFVLVRLYLRPHLVSRFPDRGCKLMFIHG